MPAKNLKTLEKLRKLCLALPETCEIEAWGHPTFRASKKMFAAFGGYDDSPNIGFKVGFDRQDELVQDERFFLTPYAARQGWISLHVDGKIDWKTEGRRYRDQLISTLENWWGLTDLSKRIVVERWFTPLDLQSEYNANAGSIYGIGSNSRRTAFLRPPNRDKEIHGLYFCGGATHPGGGLPLVALSGKIVSELVREDFD